MCIQRMFTCTWWLCSTFLAPIHTARTLCFCQILKFALSFTCCASIQAYDLLVCADGVTFFLFLFICFYQTTCNPLDVSPLFMCIVSLFQEYDLLIGADGVRSGVRAALQDQVPGFSAKIIEVSRQTKNTATCI